MGRSRGWIQEGPLQANKMHNIHFGRSQLSIVSLNLSCMNPTAEAEVYTVVIVLAIVLVYTDSHNTMATTV
jgi:hypothetical protein